MDEINNSRYSQYNEIIKKGLDIRLQSKIMNNCLKWFCINIIIFVIIIYDISNKCPFNYSNWFYLEYFIASLLTISIFYYILKYICYSFNFVPITGSEVQKQQLDFHNGDSSFIIKSDSEKIPEKNKKILNNTNISWHSSFNEPNRNVGTSNWNYNSYNPQNKTGSPNRNTSWNSSFISCGSNNSLGNITDSFSSPLKNYKIETMTEERALQQYLNDVCKKEQGFLELQNVSETISSCSVNSFWNYCNTAANLLKTSLYQLSPSNVPPAKQVKNDDECGVFKTNGFNGNSDIMRKISSAKLSRYVANLRMWLSLTIIKSLKHEILKTDAIFKSRGFSDMQIGNIGLERLKKTTENQQFVSIHVPKLPMLVKYLEMSTNQEYLVQRIKDLAKGSCIADYRWNSGSAYNGLSWDEHLPTDSAIIFHIFCTYLDAQLMPLPQPGGRPFFNRYVIVGDKKSAKETISEVKNKCNCAILCSNLNKPKFSFISGDKIHTYTNDHNSLFYVILQFLMYIKSNHDGLLEGVNLDKTGINLLCVIED